MQKIAITPEQLYELREDARRLDAQVEQYPDATHLRAAAFNTWQLFRRSVKRWEEAYPAQSWEDHYSARVVKQFTSPE